MEKNLLLSTSLGQGAFYSTRKGRNSMDEKMDAMRIDVNQD